MSRVIVLNGDYTYLNIVPIRKAIKYIINKKVEVVKASKAILRNAERTIEINEPLVVRLIRFVRVIYRSKVPFSRKNIMVRDKHVCQYCGIKAPKLTLDHVIPISKGGKSNWENCVAACLSCNNKKDNKTPSQVKMTLKRLPSQPTIMEFLLIKMKYLGIENILKDLDIY